MSENFLGYTIISLNYRLLQQLIAEIFINQEYCFESDNENPLIFDCGANMGIATLYFKWLFPKSVIFAFEPDPRIFQLLKENVDNNHLSDVNLFNIALSDKQGFIEFYSPALSDEWNFGKGSIVNIPAHQFEIKTNVNCDVLSRYVKNSKIDFMKIDIEGAESDVIKELNFTNKLDRIKQGKIEYHHKLKEPRFGPFLDMFESREFTYQIHSGNIDREYQYFLIHFYRKN